jgi:hypothetical protein
VGNFDVDLIVGQDFEDRTAAYLNDDTHNYLNIQGNFPAFDLICDKTYNTIECKRDLIAGRTGNFFFEIEGLLTKCQARELFYEIDDKVYVFNFKKLKDYLRQLYVDGVRPVSGGDNKKFTGMLLPIDSLRSMWQIEYY